MITHINRLLWPALIFGFMSGCASTRDLSSTQEHTQERATQAALTMIGKPYRFGGNSPERGFDCSGLVQYSYSRAGARVPRSTEQLRDASRRIASSDLRRGDLLFFNQEKKSSHVALYLGDGRFVHAPSTGKNVHVADFGNQYWRNHFQEARRLDVN